MKVNSFAILSLFSLASVTVARRGNRFRAYDDNDPIEEKSHVTAFINTGDGLKVECWQIGDLLPNNHVTRADGSKGTVRRKNMEDKLSSIALLSFSPGVTIFSLGATGVHSNAVDFRAKPNLFTIKGGLILIEASGDNVATRGDDDDESTFVFSLENGDDWFYFEDQTSGGDDDVEQCAKTTSESTFDVRTISGSDSTLINFEYERTPRHKVVHEGRCNFAGLKPVSPPRQRNTNSRKSHFRSQDL